MYVRAFQASSFSSSVLRDSSHRGDSGRFSAFFRDLGLGSGGVSVCGKGYWWVPGWDDEWDGIEPHMAGGGGGMDGGLVL